MSRVGGVGQGARVVNRRGFLAAVGGLAAGAAGAAGAAARGQQGQGQSARGGGGGGGKFKLKYAPHLSMFQEHVGRDAVENIKFAADQGFRAVFDNGLMGRSAAEQEAIAGEVGRQGMTLGPFGVYAEFREKSLVVSSKGVREMLTERLKQGVEVAKRTQAQWALVVPGRYDESLEWGYQTANVIENLKHGVGLCEPAGLVLVIEPLNPWDHPGLFLTKMPQAYEICRAVGSPSCKINDDLYHQQITEGNLIPNLDRAWSEIGALHVGDNPGRKEPGTGEINYRNIFQHLHQKGYEGVLCLEHGMSRKGKEGEERLLAAYRECDDF